MKKQTLIVQDVLGISSASICLVHCIVFPLLSVLPLGIAHNPWIDVFFFCIAFILVSKIAKGKAPLYVKIHLLISLVLVFLGICIEFIGDLETYLVPLGGVGMIIGHVLHYFYHKNNYDI